MSKTEQAEAKLAAATRDVYLTGSGDGWRTQAHRDALAVQAAASRELAAARKEPVRIDEDGMCAYIL